MPSRAVRKFTLFDAMVLIAATAIGLAPVRFLHASILAGANLSELAASSIAEAAIVVIAFSAPLVVAWSAALLALRLKKPRPRIWQAFRQPGTIACSAILFTTLCVLLLEALKLPLVYFQLGPESVDIINSTPEELTLRFSAIGSVFPVVCAVSWLGKVCRPEKSWIDRAGRALGVYWTLSAILVYFVDVLA